VIVIVEVMVFVADGVTVGVGAFTTRTLLLVPVIAESTVSVAVTV